MSVWIFVFLIVMIFMLAWNVSGAYRRIEQIEFALDKLESLDILKRLTRVEGQLPDISTHFSVSDSKVYETANSVEQINDRLNRLEVRICDLERMGVIHISNAESLQKLEQRVNKLESNDYTFVPYSFSPHSPMDNIILTNTTDPVTEDTIEDSDDDKYWSIGEVPDGETD